MTSLRPLKILHIISGDLWAGAEVQAFTLLTALHNTPDIDVFVVLMNEGELAEQLRKANIAITVLPESAMSALAIFLALRQLLAQWKPDIVHTHRNKENILGSLANRLSINAPSVRTVHGATESTPVGLRQFHKHVLAYLNHWTGRHLQQKIIAVAPELAKKLAPIFPIAKIVVIENGVDIDRIRAQAQLVDFKIDQPNAIHLGIIGRLVPVKRVDLFLEIAALLRKEHPQYDWRFHIIGSGPREQALKQQAQELKMLDRATFHGHRTDVVACIASLDALIMCSDHEGLPMTLLEALALNKPVIGHAVGGIQSTLELVDPQRLVHEQSPRAFADAVVHTIRELQAGSLTQNQTVFAERFSATSNLHKTLAVYRNTLEEARA